MAMTPLASTSDNIANLVRFIVPSPKSIQFCREHIIASSFLPARISFLGQFSA
jgi:hypothetical protein